MKYKQVPSIFVVAVAAVSGLASPLDAASLTFAEDTPLEGTWPDMRVPKWSNGATISVQYDESLNPVIWLLERQGPHAVPFTIPGAKNMQIFDLDRGIDGTIALSGAANDGEGRYSCFVAWISRDEATSNVIRTSLYTPNQVAVAPDGTLWTAGSEFMIGSHLLKPESGVIRHFDRTGRTLGSFVSQSTIPQWNTLWNPFNQLRASKDRIVWYSPKEGRYVEISLTGQMLMDISIQSPGEPESRVDGLAATDKGQVFVSAVWYSAPTAGSKERTGFRGIYSLDKSTQAWQPMLQRTFTTGVKANPSASDFDSIYGVDDDRLVINSVQRRLMFYKIEE